MGIATKQLNRVRVNSSTTDDGPIALGSATSDLFLSFAEANAIDGAQYRCIVFEGSDFMIVLGTYSSTGPTLTVDEVHISKIGGVAGTTQMNLNGGATIRVIASDEDFDEIFLAIEEANNQAIVMAAALGG